MRLLALPAELYPQVVCPATDNNDILPDVFPSVNIFFNFFIFSFLGEQAPKKHMFPQRKT